MNIYDSVSVGQILERGADQVPDKISWKAETPHGTSVRFQVRISNSMEKLN